MPLTERSQELIQKYLEAIASEPEIAELEGLLATDAEVAAAFAAAARLEAGLQSYFRQQYKIDQVAGLLNAPEPSSSSGAGQSAANAGDASRSGGPADSQVPANSTFIPRLDRLADARRATAARRLESARRRWKSIAVAALVLLTLGIGVWSSMRGKEEPFRLVSGRLTEAGQELSGIPENSTFEVAGEDGAVIELPGGMHIELTAATRASIRHDRTGAIVNVTSGGGEFYVPEKPSTIRVETAFGVVITAGARFSLVVVAGRPAQSSQPATSPLPSLTVVVAEGSVIVERGGSLVKLPAGQQRVFFSPT